MQKQHVSHSTVILPWGLPMIPASYVRGRFGHLTHHDDIRWPPHIADPYRLLPSSRPVSLCRPRPFFNRASALMIFFGRA